MGDNNIDTSKPLYVTQRLWEELKDAMPAGTTPAGVKLIPGMPIIVLPDTHFPTNVECFQLNDGIRPPWEVSLEIQKVLV